MRPLGLYLHIPFCAAKCAYCDFYSLPGQDDAAMDRYADALCRHLAAFAPRTTSYTVDTVYFGGGTPSLLGEARLLCIWEAVRDNYALSPDAEVTVEANPDSVGDWFASLRAAGFNRVSLGMQSAHDDELRAIGRIHTAAQTREAVRTLRRAGFHNLSLDLIYGLPGQTMARWRENVSAALSLEPEHLSCYGLKVEPGTPLWAVRDSANLPGDEAQAELYLWAAEELDRRGYRQYEISNFAKPGRQSRHNLKYWTLGEYAGFGPAAHSDFGGVRYAFTRDLSAYRAGVLRGETDEPGDKTSPGEPHDSALYAEYTPISPAEREREYLLLGLRTSAGIDVSRFPPGRYAAAEPFLRRCAAAGYGRLTAGRFALTPRGFLVSNRIIGELLDLWDGG